MIISIKDNFISKKDCDFIIKTYHDNKDKVRRWRDTYPLSIHDFGNLTNKLNKEAKVINNSVLDWIEIVKWTIGSKHDLHYDMAKSNTTLASIIYLNEDFTDGYTYFEDGTIIAPKIGRVVFFDGCYYKHGVKEIKNSNRFTVAGWFKGL